MKRLALAAALLTACAAPSDGDVAVSGTPDRPEPVVRALSAKPALGDRVHQITTTTTTTTVPPTTTTKAVVPVTAAPAVIYSGDCGGWGDLIAQHFGNQASKACSVMLCESGGNPTAENPRSTASGLFQFLDSTWVRARSMVGADQYARASHAPGPLQVAAAAAWLRATSWSQWECA